MGGGDDDCDNGGCRGDVINDEMHSKEDGDTNDDGENKEEEEQMMQTELQTEKVKNN